MLKKFFEQYKLCFLLVRFTRLTLGKLESNYDRLALSYIRIQYRAYIRIQYRAY